MIPTFPEFKSLESTDREAVESVVHTFPPNSDLNFTNLYAWDARVSSLHGNLAVQFTEYDVGDGPFFSFIGSHYPVNSALQLLELAEAQYRSAQLRLVPENAALELEKAGFALTPDDAATDYMFAVDHIAGMHEWPQHSVRRRIRQFAARHPEYTVRYALLPDIDVDEFRGLFALWAALKGYASPQASHEYLAFERFLRSADPRVETIGLYVGARLIGFSTFELLPCGTAIVHFSKADNAFHGGACSLLYWEEARLLLDRSVTHYNWGSDLGLPRLRQSKQKYRPCHFIKKFTVSQGSAVPPTPTFRRMTTA
ncbi:MAG: DUF2156 domain-containing protein [Sulfuritalea sp.]|nr:DUF2156 domain-containing protein [Sulfuritalea sp.]